MSLKSIETNDLGNTKTAQPISKAEGRRKLVQSQTINAVSICQLLKQQHSGENKMLSLDASSYQL